MTRHRMLPTALSKALSQVLSGLVVLAICFATLRSADDGSWVHTFLLVLSAAGAAIGVVAAANVAALVLHPERQTATVDEGRRRLWPALALIAYLVLGVVVLVTIAGREGVLTVVVAAAIIAISGGSLLALALDTRRRRRAAAPGATARPGGAGPRFTRGRS